MEKAIGAYRHVTATDEFKEIERMFSRARHNEAAALRNARTEAEIAKALDIARNLLGMNMPPDQIAAATGLTREEIEGLRSVN